MFQIQSWVLKNKRNQYYFICTIYHWKRETLTKLPKVSSMWANQYRQFLFFKQRRLLTFVFGATDMQAAAGRPDPCPQPSRLFTFAFSTGSVDLKGL